MIMHFDVTEKEREALLVRADRAMMPLSSYILAAALNPIKYAWPEDAHVPVRLRLSRRSKKS